MRIAFALPGLHSVKRGAEIAFLAIASALARKGETVTLIGSGPEMPDQPYHYLQANRVPRDRFEKWPTMPIFRSDVVWEEASFLPGLLRRYRPSDYDLTVTCAYPFTNWALRRPVIGGRRPAHVFVTQNGDWPARADNSEFRWFDCDGLVCINPDFYETNRGRYRSALIPNGVDTARFTPGPADRMRFGLPEDRPIVLMASAMIASKNVADGVRAVSAIPGAILVVAGDGPLRGELQSLADSVMPGRYRPMSVASSEMPALYRCSNAFLHLSHDEPFGNVYVEALACGLPLVAWDLPRTRWILGNEAFWIDRETRSITDALVAALRTGADESEKRVQRASQFDWERIGESYREFFQQVIASRS